MLEGSKERKKKCESDKDCLFHFISLFFKIGLRAYTLIISCQE